MLAVPIHAPVGVPGASLALVDGGCVVFEGGFGVRELDSSDPVDENTLFMAASNTKGMTTLLLSRLADQGKLCWDQPVTELYPSFKLGDAATTGQVLVRHLVCAYTGLPRQDLEWIFEFKNATPESSMALLGTMQPTSRFGEVFQYSNLIASAAGYLGAHIYDPKRDLGAAYDEAMQNLIFKPLGMNSTTFDYTRALRGNHAMPHGDDVDGTPRLASMDFNYAVVPHRPAGGVWTSAHDLVRYVQLELARGKLPDGTRLVSEENILARRTTQVATGENQSYGMGLSVDKTWGVTVVHHGGSIAGFKSDLMFLPDYGVGAVLLTNSDTGGMLLRPLMRRLLEVMFGGKPEAAGNVDAAAVNYNAARAKERERLVVPADPALIAKLAPHYTSAALGDISVHQHAGTTAFDFGEWKHGCLAQERRRNDILHHHRPVCYRVRVRRQRTFRQARAGDPRRPGRVRVHGKLIRCSDIRVNGRCSAAATCDVGFHFDVQTVNRRETVFIETDQGSALAVKAKRLLDQRGAANPGRSRPFQGGRSGSKPGPRARLPAPRRVYSHGIVVQLRRTLQPGVAQEAFA